MDKQGNRLVMLTGLVAVALFLAGAVVFDFYTYLPDPAEIQAHLVENDTETQMAGYFGMLGAFFLLWFASSLRSNVRAAEGGDGMLSNIVFGGTVAAATMLLAGFAAMMAAGGRAGADVPIDEMAAATSYDLWGTLVGSAVPFALGATIAAYALVAARTNVMPMWFAWVSAIIAVGSISPFNYIFIALAMLWVAYVSIAMWWAQRNVGEPMAGV
jgi:hypothetical protein